jgi:hypothetical protein
MTTLELRTSIVAELDQMSVEMLESVQHYVRRLRRHARTVNRTTAKVDAIITRNGKDFTASKIPVMTATEYLATLE